MAKQIIWTPEAESAFEKVIAYLFEKWTEKEVQNFIHSTNRVVRYISEHPLMFRKTNKKNVREALITPHNLLAYKVYKDRIDLVTFWDTRQNPRKRKH